MYSKSSPASSPNRHGRSQESLLTITGKGHSPKKPEKPESSSPNTTKRFGLETISLGNGSCYGSHRSHVPAVGGGGPRFIFDEIYSWIGYMVEWRNSFRIYRGVVISQADDNINVWEIKEEELFPVNYHKERLIKVKPALLELEEYCLRQCRDEPLQKKKTAVKECFSKLDMTDPIMVAAVSRYTSIYTRAGEDLVVRNSKGEYMTLSVSSFSSSMSSPSKTQIVRSSRVDSRDEFVPRTSLTSSNGSIDEDDDNSDDDDDGDSDDDDDDSDDDDDDSDDDDDDDDDSDDDSDEEGDSDDEEGSEEDSLNNAEEKKIEKKMVENKAISAPNSARKLSIETFTLPPIEATLAAYNIKVFVIPKDVTRGFSLTIGDGLTVITNQLSKDYDLDIAVNVLKLHYMDEDGDRIDIVAQSDFEYVLKSHGSGSKNGNSKVLKIHADWDKRLMPSHTSRESSTSNNKHFSQTGTGNTDSVSPVTMSVSEETTKNLDNQRLAWQKGELIGAGSFGRVYSGIDLVTGNRIAVKEIAMKRGKRYQEQAMLITREVKLLSTLDHPNIVKYLGTEYRQHNIRIFLELANDGSVKDIIQEFGALSELLIRRFTYDIVKGLHFLHSKNIIHRDIKPSNLLVFNGVIKLADFGCASISSMDDGTTEFGHSTVAGTTIYMSPEILQSEQTNDDVPSNKSPPKSPRSPRLKKKSSQKKLIASLDDKDCDDGKQCTEYNDAKLEDSNQSDAKIAKEIGSDLDESPTGLDGGNNRNAQDTLLKLVLSNPHPNKLIEDEKEKEKEKEGGKGAKEKKNRRGYGRRTDIWSLGITIVEISLGKSPFRNAAAAIYSICVSKQYPKFPDNMSESAHFFLSRCLLEDPKNRASSHELLGLDFLKQDYSTFSAAHGHDPLTKDSVLERLPEINPKDVLNVSGTFSVSNSFNISSSKIDLDGSGGNYLLSAGALPPIFTNDRYTTGTPGLNNRNNTFINGAFSPPDRNDGRKSARRRSLSESSKDYFDFGGEGSLQGERGSPERRGAVEGDVSRNPYLLNNIMFSGGRTNENNQSNSSYNDNSNNKSAINNSNNNNTNFKNSPTSEDSPTSEQRIRSRRNFSNHQDEVENEDVTYSNMSNFFDLSVDASHSQRGEEGLDMRSSISNSTFSQSRSYLFTDSFRQHFGESVNSNLVSTSELTFINKQERGGKGSDSKDNQDISPRSSDK